MSEIPKKVGVIGFVAEIKPLENYPDFEKLAIKMRNSNVRANYKQS